ncbi:MAG: sirohydrochlorin cobaltochelatase [Cellulosilyticaceae bacterium]
MKKAIVLVSFGTTHIEQLKNSLLTIESGVKQEFINYDVIHTFSSVLIINKIKQQHNIIIHSFQEVMDELIQKQYDEVIVQPLHILEGKEYEKVTKWSGEYTNQIKIKIGKPLLESQDDYTFVAHKIKNQFKNEDKISLIIGHGTEHKADVAYKILEKQLKIINWQGKVTTLANIEEIASISKYAKKNQLKEIVIIPFMIVAGNHVKNEILGNEKTTWQGALEEEGLKVTVVKQGLGQFKWIEEIFINHIKTAIDLK